jgi:hypothetical protein
MYLIMDCYVIYYGVILIKKLMDGVKIKEELVIHLELSMFPCFVRSKI